MGLLPHTFAGELKRYKSFIHIKNKFMALSMGIQRDVQVSFSISDVKSAIDRVSSVSKAYYQIKSKDDIMNTYDMSLVGGLAVVVPLKVQLKKISDTETQILLTSNKATNTGNQANDIVDKFMGLVSKALSGEEITEEVVSKGKSGCLGFFIFLIGIGAGMVYLLF
jgi:hypothetical protein